MRRNRPIVIAALVVLCGAAIAFAIWPEWLRGTGPSVSVYCAHDSVFADAILKDFERQSGIRVDVHYDSEATKSLGFVNQLKLEKDDPHCDVFWNNELLGTMDLAHDGLLEPYQGTGYARIPSQYKDDDGRWTGFAARIRVWIVNTNWSKKNPVTEENVQERFDQNLKRAAIAKPIYGTTLTQYSILWNLWGPERLKKWDADVRRRGLLEVAGNARVKDAVAAGECDLGWTDTDDYYEAVDDNKPVAMLPLLIDDPTRTPPPKSEKGSQAHHYTIVIPNTVSLIRGCRHPSPAKKLIDFLLSAETELTLANSKSRQTPLGPVDSAQLPPDVRKLAAYVGQGYDLRSLESARRDCLAWLKSESRQ